MGVRANTSAILRLILLYMASHVSSPSFEYPNMHQIIFRWVAASFSNLCADSGFVVSPYRADDVTTEATVEGIVVE